MAMREETVRAKALKGLRAYHNGAAAEQLVAADYDRRGVHLLEARWRGQGGEIDLIFRERDTFVFCEVKAASSITAAIARLQPAQMRRIHAAASEYLGQTSKGQLSEVRFDLAVVDGRGGVTVLENAFGHF